jgi:histidine triad (HIT) family protein
MPTLFERIISGELPASFVYRDEQVSAFRDIHPRAPTHVLIVPNKPIPTANELTAADEKLIGHMVLVAAQIARGEGIADSGYRLVINCNRDSGMEVAHLHLHLLGGKPLGAMVSTMISPTAST